MAKDMNSFVALGFADDEAVIAALRTDLAGIVRDYIQRAQLNQVAAARQLGIPQSTISAIINDRIDNLSAEYFLRILTRLRIPWTAKCWHAPHDALWVAGGVSQLLAASAVSKVSQAVKIENYWNDFVGATLHQYVVASSAASPSARTDIRVD